MTINERMFEIMKQKNIKNKELAECLGVNQTVISAWKKRGNSPPAENIVQICKLLNISYEYLLTGKEKEALTKQETELINNFRLLEPEEKEMIIKKIERILPDQETQEEKLSS